MMMMHKDYYEKGAVHEDPMMRLAIFTASIIGQYTTVRMKNKFKPFAPYAGETYEYVSEDFRFISE